MVTDYQWSGFGFWSDFILEKICWICPLSSFAALYPAKVIFDFYLALFTYMFLHTYNASHIVFNMLMLWFLGVFRGTLGTTFFPSYYLGTGVVPSGIFYCIGN